MLSLRRSLPFWLLAVPLMSLSACDRQPTELFSGLDPTPANPIAALMQQSEGSRVVVQGKVTAIAPLVKQSVYQVQDASGVVWVLTNRQAPQRYAQVKVHGVMRSSNGERYIEQK